jgi:GntR family transcriptional regulator/MocR family aminotransferase
VLRHPPGHIQRTAADFLSLGHYDAQIRRMARTLAERRKVLEEAIQRQGDRARRATEAGSCA